MDAQLVSFDQSTLDHFDQSRLNSCLAVHGMVALGFEAAELGQACRCCTVHLLPRRLYRADLFRNSSPRPELAFLLVAIAMACSLGVEP